MVNVTLPIPTSPPILQNTVPQQPPPPSAALAVDVPSATGFVCPFLLPTRIPGGLGSMGRPKGVTRLPDTVL